MPDKEQRMNYSEQFLDEIRNICQGMETGEIEKVVSQMVGLRENAGRIFFLGVGGGAAHASHAVNDFRKICQIECYAPTDNVPELTARINDEGWENAFRSWLEGSHLNNRDMLFVFSVGGGDAGKKISLPIIRALEYGKKVGAKICGVVSTLGGYTAEVADVCVKVPSSPAGGITAQTEAFQSVILHLLISHPNLRKNPMKWEQIQK